MQGALSADATRRAGTGSLTATTPAPGVAELFLVGEDYRLALRDAQAWVAGEVTETIIDPEPGWNLA